MSISAALSNAVSGLRANSTASDLISRNIANSSTEGYTRKTVKLTTQDGNVRVASVDRQVSSLLDKLDRSNVSKLSARQTVAEGVSAYTDVLGQPEDSVSPSALLSELKSSLITLSNSPDQGSSQLAVVSAAKEFASQMQNLSGTIDTVAAEVEMNIRYDVADVNAALYEVAKLNSAIAASAEGSTIRAELSDQMGQALDTLSSYMDVQTVTSKTGQVSVLTSGGTELVSGKTVNDVTYNDGTGVLMAGDVEITPGTGARGFSEGSLSGLFELKNEVLPTILDQLDAVAAAAIEGFERVAPITTDGRGLFTDAGSAYDAASIDGLAGRIAVNVDADPDLGGSPAIVQSGSIATTPSSDSTLPAAMVNLFDEIVAVPTANIGGTETLSALSASLVTNHQQIRIDAETSAETISVSAATVSTSRQNLQGVNIDDEMQQLLLVEKSYAANAKVLTTVNSMLDTLLDAF